MKRRSMKKIGIAALILAVLSVPVIVTAVANAVAKRTPQPTDIRVIYSDTNPIENIKPTVLTFGPDGNASYLAGATYGNYTQNVENDSVDILYAEISEYSDTRYLFMPKFSGAGKITTDYEYFRVLYSAEIPSGRTDGQFMIRNNKTSKKAIFADPVYDTSDTFVLSPTTAFGDTNDYWPADGDNVGDDGMLNRFAVGSHCTMLVSNITEKDCVFHVKAIYFFNNKADADKFYIRMGDADITINGNDISEYQIVIAEDAPELVYSAAYILSLQLEELAHIKVPVVRDSAPEQDKEILVGISNRSGSDLGTGTNSYSYKLSGNKLIISSKYPVDTHAGVKDFITNIMPDGTQGSIAITSANNTTASPNKLYNTVLSWRTPTNVANPTTVNINFDSDEGYFNEENAADNWTYAGGTYSSNGNGSTLTYVQVYDSNASLSSSWKYTGTPGDDAEAGMMLRFVGTEAYLKAGYDFDNGEWFIDEREGVDFYRNRLASKKATISPNTNYTLTFKTDGTTATFTVSDGTSLSASGLVHITPGRPAYFANNVAVSVDNATLSLLSGEGTIIKNAAHTLLPGEAYVEGGSVIERQDSLTYSHHNGATYQSVDNGITWNQIPAWPSSQGYFNTIRLNDGTYLQIATKSYDSVSYKIARLVDENTGKMTKELGKICISNPTLPAANTTDSNSPFYDNGYNLWGSDGPLLEYAEWTIKGGNMNDKLIQAADGTIYYGQSYEADSKEMSDGVKRNFVCGQLFMSKDNGVTWHSLGWTYEIPGNEYQTHFGESKLVVCDDGTVRLYNSWNNYGDIKYSDVTITDNGDGTYSYSWSPLMSLTDASGNRFLCSTSSMQFVRDKYAENNSTYYMVWVNDYLAYQNTTDRKTHGMPRSRLTLAKTTDGKNWTVLGDVWRWESAYAKGNAEESVHMVHLVDPFIQVTEDKIITGTGLSEKYNRVGDHNYHGAQRQHIWTIDKAQFE